MNPRQKDQVRQDKSASTRFLFASMSISDLREEEGVFESIKTRRQYDYLVREGFIRVSQAYARQRILCLTLADFRSAHTQIFGAASAEAGRIHDEECLVQIFGEFLEDCDLEGEFSLLGRQISAMASKITIAEDRVVIVAFTHARIVAAQPAIFGNKRTAMCLALSQIRALFRTIITLKPFDVGACHIAVCGESGHTYNSTAGGLLRACYARSDRPKITDLIY
jgi:hypothetical protein